MGYFKKHGWLIIMTILVDYVTLGFWHSYLVSGSIHDGKHGLTFIGESAYGHLVGITIFGAILTFYSLKSAVRYLYGD
ncbi:hypothetical protein EHLJMEHL_04921 [Vreelandella titanicae]